MEIQKIYIKEKILIQQKNKKKQIELKNEENNQQNNNELNKDSIIYKGNKNNIPYVTISENGLFIGNNSIDKSFKIFDFYTGELICSCINPNSEWGWGIKFIPKDLFTIKNIEFDDYELRKNNNLCNMALERCHMTDLNLTNPSPYDENNFHKIPYNNLNYKEKYLKLNLIDKYYNTCSFY